MIDERAASFLNLIKIMDELREKCPWDKKQTIESIRHLTIEETFELSDAILKNDLNEIKKELGDLEKISRFVRLSGFVNSVPEFTQHPKVINAASDLLYEIFGEHGKHTRIAVGVSSLPLDAMTEIDAIVEIKVE